jgi:Phosphate-starvation-inducible E family
MDLTYYEEKLRSNSAQYLYLLETIFYVVAGFLLCAAAAVAMFEAAEILWRALVTRTFADYGLLMLDRLLLVLMLVEILHTVRTSILSKEFMFVIPFLIVGLIASVRRVLVITMHAAKLSEQDLGSAQRSIAFRSEMVELGLLGFLVLVFALSIVLPESQPARRSHRKARSSDDRGPGLSSYLLRQAAPATFKETQSCTQTVYSKSARLRQRLFVL